MDKKKIDLLSALAIFSIVAIIVYIVVRTILLFFAEYTFLERTLAILLIAGELFVAVHGIGYVLNIIRSLKHLQKAEWMHVPKDEPSVAVLVAARHEPKEVLEATFLTICNLNYRNKKVFFLDDSTIASYNREADEISGQCNIHIFRRKERHGAKAGIINDCLKGLDQKYVAIFDADQNPLPDFLNVVIPILERDERLAFVQTPQFYSNGEDSLVARAAGFQQDVFYEFICEGKSTGGAMFCCGTNSVFRRQALAEVGGMDESTVTEDFATSVKLHARGWKSLYYNHVYAFGMGPVSLADYFKQQFRWAIGTISVFKKVLAGLFLRRISLTPLQWWEYFLSSSYYLIGFAFFIMILCPVIYLLFRVPSFFARPEIYFLAFLPYIILSMSIFYTALKGRNYRPRDLLLGQLLGEVSITVYIRAALSVFLGVKTSFGITGKSKAISIPYRRLWPQLSLLGLCFLSLVWGLNRYIYEREPAILVNSFWALYHCLVLTSVFYFNRGEEK